MSNMNTARTPLFYMANLGSEVTRALLEYERKEYDKMERSLSRAEEIIQRLEQFPEMQGRTGELEILRSIIEDLNQKKLEVNKNHLINYFTPFALRLMSI